LDDPNSKPGENWTNKISICPENLGWWPQLHFPEERIDLTLPGTPAVIPPDERIAQRLGVGKFEWCLLSDNTFPHGSLSFPNSKNYELLLMGRFQTVSNSAVFPIKRYLRTKDPVKLPRYMFVGGVVGSYWEPSFNGFIREQWPNLLLQLAGPEEPSATSGELANASASDSYFQEFALKPFPDGSKQFDKLMRGALSDKIYDLINVDQVLAKQLSHLETVSLVIRAFGNTAVPEQIQSNDALETLLGGSNALLSKTSLDNFREQDRSALDLTKISAFRGEAAERLLERAFLARSALGSQSSPLEATIHHLEQFYNDQMELCQHGKKPIAACQG
jgi:hypothetical protein